jgi:hypothetical protein
MRSGLPESPHLMLRGQQALITDQPQVFEPDGFGGNRVYGEAV